MENDQTSFDVTYLPPRIENLHCGLEDVFAYWLEIAGDRFAPDWRDFDWNGIPASFVPYVSVVDVVRDPLDFIYRFWGTGRTRLQGQDYTGKSVADFEPASIARKGWEEYQTVAEKREPIHVITKNLSNAYQEPFHYHGLRLPFSCDGQSVSHVLGIAAYDQEAIAKAQRFYGNSGLSVMPPSVSKKRGLAQSGS